VKGVDHGQEEKAPRIYGPFGLFRDARLELFSTTRIMSFLLAGLVVGGLLGLIGFTLHGSAAIFRARGLSFLTDARWDFREREFGVASLLYGTVVTSMIAVALAVPVSILAATFVSEILPGRLRGVVKQLIELLAAVPSIVYGLLGIILLQPLVHTGLPFLGAKSGDSLLTGGLLLAVMICPTIVTLAEDALRDVPRADRDAARSLGLTRSEAVVAVVWPRAWPGMLAAILLGLGRALGETIAVYLVIGRSDGRLPGGLTDWGAIVSPGQTLTTKLGGSEIALSWGDPLHWSAMMGVAAILLLTVAFFMTAGLAFRGGRR